MWNYLYNDTTGELISEDSTYIGTIADHSVTSYEDRQGQGATVWDAPSRSFIPATPNTRILKPEFYKRVGLARFGALIVAAKGEVELESVLAYLNAFDVINLADPETVYGMSVVVAKGVWTQADVDEILSV